MTPEQFGEALGWDRVIRAHRVVWVSDGGTYVSIGHHGSKLHITHRVTVEEAWIPLDGCAADYVRAFDEARPSA